MKKIYTLALTIAIGAFAFLLPAPVGAVNLFEACDSVEGRPANPVCEARGEDAWTLVGNIISVLLLLIGVVAVVMIIIGGFRYITANGDSGAISSAKNTIMYSIIGLVVALAAYAIVTFVISNI